jgi:sec-independent protein translocase protein TatB
MLLDIAPSEFLLIAAVAIVCIGPKDMPRALRTAGRWIGKMRRVSGHFRAGMETLIREAELEEMEKTWREQNEAILKAHPAELPDASGQPASPHAELGTPALPAPAAESVPPADTPPAPDISGAPVPAQPGAQAAGSPAD